MNREELNFESFNAKNIPNDKISKSFISNDEFFEIARNNHTLIMGPRGCGKTTMLKMLTAPAINNWQPKNSREINIKTSLPFIAIYIPADEIWQEQFRELEESLKAHPSQWHRIKDAIFTTNVHVSYVKSIREYVNEYYPKSSIETEAIFCKSIVRAFLLRESTIPTLKSVQAELEFRFSEIFVKHKRVVDLGESDFSDFYRQDFLKTIVPLCTEFESLYHINESIRWALCFDELELAPKDIFIKLLKYLRAVPQKFLFKLSTAPTLSFDLFENVGDTPTGKKDHDYDNVTMWPDTSEKSERYRIFCKNLALTKIGNYIKARYNVTAKFTLNEIFGEFDMTVPLGTIKSVVDSKGVELSKLVISAAEHYEKGSLEWVALKEYATIDTQFADYLESKKISSTTLESNVKSRDEVLRKIIEIVYNRLIFVRYKKGAKGELLKSDVGGNTNPKFYFGTKTILQIVDGNPRYLIGLIDEFQKYITLDISTGRLSKVTPEIQHKIIEATANRLLNKFKSVPIVRGTSYAESIDSKKRDHLSKLILEIGQYFKKRLNYDKLSTDPPSCFVIDSKSINDKYLVHQIKMGVYLGAFIALPKQTGELDSYEENLSGERFRLAYLLSPLFNLPLRQYKSISLDHCRTQSDNSSSQLAIH